MTFRFRLNSVLRLREDECRRKQTAFAEAQRIVKTIVNTVSQLDAELQSIVLNFRVAGTAETLNVEQLIQTKRHLHQLQTEHHRVKSNLQVARQKLDDARAELLDAEKQAEMLRRLQQKQLAEHDSQIARAETRELDEIANIHHRRTHRQPTEDLFGL